MLNNSAENPGAIIIDGHGQSDLGVVRALGERGVPVYLFTDSRCSPVALSRYVSEVLPFPGSGAGEEERVGALVQAGKRFRHRPVFFSTGDSSAVLFSRHRTILEAYYLHHLSAPELVEGLYDKIRFAELASERSLEVPFTLAPKTLAELEAALDRFRFPVVVKPAEKRRWAEHPEIIALVHGNLKAVRIDTPEALLDFYRVVARYDTAIVIQNYIEGRDEAIWELHAFIDRDGDLVGVFTGRKLRTYPVHRGIGCFQVSEYEPAVVEVGLRTLRALGYTGHAAVQLKRLPGSNRFEIFEINCRYSAWNDLHRRAGVNMPYAAYCDCLGQKQLPLPRQREGMRWVDVSNDLRAFRDYRRLGEWSLAQWARSYIGRNHYAFFDWRDPLPGLVPYGRGAMRLASLPLRWRRRRLVQSGAQN
jgi:D-aspartate ligase